jgi:TPR repeat protein
VRYLKLAADQNHSETQPSYDVCLHHGLGVSIDVVRVAIYFKLAADQNHPGAQ